jgi:hypothetical protein
MLGRSLSVCCGMVALELEDLAAISRKIVSISLMSARFNVADPQDLPRRRVNRPSSPMYEGSVKSLGDNQAWN